MIIDKYYESLKTYHGVLRRRDDSILEYQYLQRHVLDLEPNINSLTWNPHCVFLRLRAGADFLELKDFQYPEMKKVYDWFAEWIEEDDIDDDVDEKEEILVWLTKNNIYEDTIDMKFQKILVDFYEWVNNNKDDIQIDVNIFNIEDA